MIVVVQFGNNHKPHLPLGSCEARRESFFVQSQQAQDLMHEDGGAGATDVAMDGNTEEVRLVYVSMANMWNVVKICHCWPQLQGGGVLRSASLSNVTTVT